MTQHCTKAFAGDGAPIAGWFVTAKHPLIQQCFYAAIDIGGALCWTDEPTSAEQFPERQDAERFAAQACPDEDWAVSR